MIRCVSLILTILLCVSLSFAEEQFDVARMSLGVVGGGVVAVAGCTTSNDSKRIDHLAKTGTGNITSAKSCGKFNFAASTTVTEYVAMLCDSNQTGSIRVSIYTHNSGTDLPDAIVTGTDKTLAHGSVADCGSPSAHTFTLDTPKTGLSGTYWLCFENTDMTMQLPFDAAAGERTTYGPDVTSNPIDNYISAFDIYGCLE